MVNLVNLTPHPIIFIGWGEVKPSGKPARLTETTKVVGSIKGRAGEVICPVIKKVLGQIIDLPEPQPDTVFIVSLPVAQAARREDVLAIGESVRDEKGNVVGAKSLAVV